VFVTILLRNSELGHAAKNKDENVRADSPLKGD